MNRTLIIAQVCVLATLLTCCIADGCYCCVVHIHCLFLFLQDCVTYCMLVISLFHHAQSPHLSVTHTICLHFYFLVSRPGMGGIKSPISFCLYRVSQEDCARLREGVPYVKVYRYNPKQLCPNLNGYGDNGQRSLKL